MLTRGGEDNYYQEFIKTKYAKICIKTTAVKAWEVVPDNIKIIQKKHLYKKQLQRHIGYSIFYICMNYYYYPRYYLYTIFWVSLEDVIVTADANTHFRYYFMYIWAKLCKKFLYCINEWK